MIRPMLDALPDAPLPDGLLVRAAHAEQYRAIWEAIQEAFRDHWGSFPTTEWHYQQWLDDPNFDPALWRVAWDGDQIAGVTLGEIRAAENRQYHRARGWIEDVAVRRPWRRRGLARALIAQTIRALQERGMTEAALDVDSENLTGALGLYQSLGFQVAKRFATFRKLVRTT